jgi:hypothetical protein
MDRDLNRAWTLDQIQRLRNGGVAQGVEDREQEELLSILETAMEEAPEELYLMDLHTTSGSGAAFSTVADTLRNRELALRLPVPMVLGLEELVEGTLHDYTGRLGVVTVAFESGQHQEDEAVDRAEAALWLMLAATGLLDTERYRETLAQAHRTLEEDHRHLPRALEMRYRHPVVPDDRFAMKDGYLNFQRVRKGEEVASDLDGPVLVPENARILMPLYQEQGKDGFFIVREFRPFWLRVSAVMRRMNLDRIVHWLPGIRRHPRDSQSLVVNRHVARWYALQVLHLLGFRRELDVGDVLVVQRRARGR